MYALATSFTRADHVISTFVLHRWSKIRHTPSQEGHVLLLRPYEASEEDPELSEAAVSIVDERRHDGRRHRRFRWFFAVAVAKQQTSVVVEFLM
jgi:hypothetical protein